MLRAHSQADTYIRALPLTEGKPPFLLLTDVGRSLEIHAEFSRSGSVYTPFPDSHAHRIKLEQLRAPAIRTLLATIWTNPLSLNPASKAAKVTRAIANHLAELAKSLETQHSAETVGTFLMRCLFTMFAEDVGLLPKDSFTRLLEDALAAPATFPPTLLHLWNLMNTCGFDVLSKQAIKHFNGGLFAGVSALPLSKGQIQMLYLAARTDWRLVEPAIFGTLLERALNPNERHKLGAHYTPRAYVERLVLPTVLAPLRDEWKNIQGAATILDQQGKHDKAIAEIRAFHTRLCGLRILDPACGSGNFLYDDLATQLVGQPGATTPLPDKAEAQAHAEEELLSRLVDLNTQRAAEEAQGHIRWLRPDFQSPSEQTSAPLAQNETDSDADIPAAITAPASKLSWPKAMPEQVKIVRAQLAVAPLSLPALTAQFKNKPKGVEPAVNALVALGLVVDEQGVYRVV